MEITKCYKLYKPFALQNGVPCPRYFVWAKNPAEAKKVLSRNVDVIVTDYTCVRYELLDGIKDLNFVITQGQLSNSFSLPSNNKES